MAENISLIANALGSAAAGIIGRIFTHPLDTAKARLQAPGEIFANRYQGPIDVLVQTSRNEGIRGLYRGFGAVIVGGTPGTVVYLCSYDIAKTRLPQLASNDNSYNDTRQDGNFVVHFCSGMIAETVACLIYVPVDVIKERMQVQQASHANNTGTYYRNFFDAISQISRNEGLAGIYRGYGATLMSFGPFSALYFVFYEKAKAMTRNHWLTQDTPLEETHLTSEYRMNIPFHWIVICSASSGALASWLTSPLDMAKLRLQVQRGKSYELETSSTTHYRGVIDCLRHSMQTGGMRGLFRGAGARVLHFAPATTITMSTYEFCRSLVGLFLTNNYK
jgi:hypothetical protein